MEQKGTHTLEVPGGVDRVGSSSAISAQSYLTEDSDGVSFEQHKGDKLWVLVSRASFTYGILIILISITVGIAYISNADIVQKGPVDGMKLCFYVVAVLGMTTLLFLGVQGKLTKNDHYRDRKKASFVRGGMLVLGSSAFMYWCLYVYEYIVRPSWCRSYWELVQYLLGLMTVLLEISFLLVFAKVRINRTRGVALVARVLVMHMIATNVVLWLYVVMEESLHEIDSVVNGNQSHFSAEHSVDGVLFVDTAVQYGAATDDPSCPAYSLMNTLSNYLFPLIIEFAVVVTNMWLGVWENCGVGIIYQNPEDRLDGNNSRRKSILTDGMLMEKQTGYKNKNGGFIIGWLTLLFTLVVTLVYLFWVAGSLPVYTADQANMVGYAVNVGLSGLLLITVIVATYRLQSLPTKGHDAKKETGNTLQNKLAHLMDRRLLFGTGMALVIFKLNCLIAGAATGEYLIVADAVMSIVASMGQTMFIGAFALEKVCVTNYQRKVKPGRQSLELIRFSNLSLWIANTFILKSPSAKSVQYEVFGRVGWAAVSNIFQPLTILHYFHAMVCVAEVVVDVYSDKNIYTMEMTIEPASNPHPVSKLPVQGIPFDYVPSVSSSVS